VSYFANRPVNFQASNNVNSPFKKEAGRKVSKSGFVASAIREISVGLCRGNYQMYRGVACRGPAVGSVRELLTPLRRCCDRYVWSPEKN
jgi:hypothetical protein